MWRSAHAEIVPLEEVVSSLQRHWERGLRVLGLDMTIGHAAYCVACPLNEELSWTDQAEASSALRPGRLWIASTLYAESLEKEEPTDGWFL